MKQIRQVTSDVWRVTSPVTHHASRITRRAFSLIEIMIVMALLSVIVIGLMAMFGQVQKAFLGSVTQTDVLESGRATTEMLSRELTGVIPSQQSQVINFYSQILYPPATPQTLPGSQANSRTNVIESLYFLTQENQTWTGYAYLVDDNGAGVGTLYRSMMSTNISGSPQNLFPIFPVTPSANTNWHRVIDGVVQFRFRAFDADGRWITTNLLNNTGLLKSDNIFSVVTPGEVDRYVFKSNAVPAYIEFEIGILEKRTYERFKALPSAPATVRQNYLKSQAGKTHLFRQRVPVRMVDVNAYQ